MILIDRFQSYQFITAGEYDERIIYIPSRTESNNLDEEDIVECIPKVNENVEIFMTLEQAQQAVEAKQQYQNDENNKPTILYKTPVILEACIYKDGQVNQPCPVRFLTFKRVICPPNVAENRIPDISKNFQHSVVAFMSALKRNETLWNLKVPKVLSRKIIDDLTDLTQQYPKPKSNSYCNIL
ncbi:MAG: hypothetical protein HYX60_01050 [Legionella longbeachae]|nr:hypothetical protein [Legionella longbeachae]